MSTTDALVPITPARLLLPSGAHQYIAAIAGMTVRELLADVPAKLLPMVHVFVNGTEVADWDGLRLREGDHILVAVVPAGGGKGSGKTILGAVLTIAVAYFAPYAAAYIVGANTGVAYAAATVAISMIGTMAINALVAPPRISTAADPVAAGSATSYSLSGQSNASRPFNCCLVVYGQHKVMPAIANNIDVDNIGTSSIMSGLYDFGLGWVDLADIRIGDVPIDQYNPELRLHQNSYCDDLTIAGQNVGYDQYAIAMQQNVPVLVRTKYQTIWAMLYIQFPKGLFQAMSKTGQAPYFAVFDAAWRRVGDSVWNHLAPENYFGADRGYFGPPLGLQWMLPNVYPWQNYVPPDSGAQMRAAVSAWRVAGGGLSDAQFAMYVNAKPNPEFAWQYPAGPIDEGSYFARYPEIHAAGWTRSAQEHFEDVGSREGRDPGVSVNYSIRGGPWQPYRVIGLPGSPSTLYSIDANDYPDDPSVGAWGWIATGGTLQAMVDRPVPQWQVAAGGLGFDEANYLARYPDVAAAVAAGQFASGWAHFSTTGCYEGRDPYNWTPTGVQVQTCYVGPYTIALRFQFETADTYEIEVVRTDKIEDGTDTSIIQASGGDITARYNESTVVLLKSSTYGQPVRPRLRHTMLEMRIQASDQLQGVVQNLSAIATSVLRMTSDGVTFTYGETRNPAWIALDILTSERNPKPLSDDAIDWPSWLHLAQACDSLRSYVYNGEPYTGPRYTCDIVVDTATTVKDLIESVLSGCRASLILTTAGKWGVLYDEEKLIPRQLITPANSWAFQGSRTYAAMPHGLHVGFVNRENAWNADQAIVYADGYDATNATEFETLDTFGITDYPHAWAYGRYMLAQGIMRSETFTVTMDVENLLVQRGDMVYVAHDVPKMGGLPTRITNVGPTASDNSGAVFANLPLAVAPTGYCVRLNDGSIRTGKVLDASTIGQFLLDDNTDVNPDDLIVFGELENEIQPYLVQRVAPGADLTATLTLCRYVAQVYDSDQGALPPWDAGFSQDLIAGTNLIVQNLTASQALYYLQRLPRVGVDLQWQTTGSYLRFHEVAVLYGDGRRDVIADRCVPQTFHYDVDALRDVALMNTPITFEVTPVSSIGYRGLPSQVSIVLVGDTTGPTMSVFGANVQKEFIDLFWSLPDDPDVSYFLLRYTPETDSPQWETSSRLESVPWPGTRTTAGARTGSYGICAVDTSGNAGNVLWRRTTVAVLPDINVITVLNDAELYPDAWPGAKSHLEVNSDENLQSVGAFGAIYPDGVYYFQHPVDLGDIFEVRVSSKIEAAGILEDGTAAPSIGLWDAWLEVRTANSLLMMADWLPSMADIDPIASVAESSWSVWRPCTVADFTAELLQFRIVTKSNNAGVRVVVTSGRVEVDMPDRVDSFADVAVTSSGLDFVFPVAFRELDAVAVSINGNADPVVAEVTAKTPEGFHVALRNTQTSALVAGSVDIMAEGYGRMRSDSI
jgi:hypothetical protein